MKDDWRPPVGTIVCVHPPSLHYPRFFGLIVDVLYAEWADEYRYVVRPLRPPRTNNREYHYSVLERTHPTFAGPICLECRKENR